MNEPTCIKSGTATLATTVCIIFLMLVSRTYAAESLNSPSLPLAEVKRLLSSVDLVTTNAASETLIKARATVFTNLIEIASENERDLELRTKAAFVIGIVAFRSPTSVHPEEAVPVLIKCLQHSEKAHVTMDRSRMWTPGQNLGWTAAQALAAIGKSASNAVPCLIDACSSKDKSTRFCALEALGRIGLEGESRKKVEEALKDPDPEVQYFARYAISISQTASEGR